MKKLFGVAVAILLFAGLAIAQNSPAGEVLGGYQFTRLFHPFDENLNGFSAGLQQNVNSWFGGEFDLGASFHTNEKFFTFMFGPQFTYRKSSSLQPFVRVQIGGARDSITNGQNDTNLALGGGGGVDVRMSRKLYFRGKADFVETFLFNQHQRYIQATIGIGYRFGTTSDSKN